MSCSTGFSILSEPRVATVENASEAEGEAALCQGHVESVESVPQATQPDVNIHSYDINTLQLEEQRVTKHNAMHWLPQGDATPNQRKSSTMLGDTPLPKTPKPNFDPFERILKPFLEQDTVQCNAWKEEVQNILIFAGLFSAVVTAFIIESYQRLQPDPNDAIVGLLAHIAETLDNPSINGTASVSSLVPNDSNFSPSHSDININIFWFISLILSLTAALVGIITLQWLREHQRYDNTLKSQQQMAIFNARVHSLEEWYVPQIFAGLPLLLQGALVLFFAGMVEFLFSLRLEVAIPVTLSICVPLIFLIVTTLLPTLQVYILQYPFRLSINDKVPSPCPYKSPQSLIFRRIGVHSETVFRFFASIVTSAYVCLVKIGCFIRKVVGSPPPIFRSHPPHFQDMLRTVDPAQVLSARDAGWTSIDMSWLFHRKFYTLSLRLACEDSANESWTQDSMVPFPDEVYDCTQRLHLVQGQVRADHYAVYCCVEAFCSDALSTFQERHIPFLTPTDIVKSQTTDFCLALGQLLCDIYVKYDYDRPSPLITASFIDDAIFHKYPDGSEITVETLCAAFMASQTRFIHSSLEPAVQNIAHEGASLLIMNRLRVTPERLFTMNGVDMWLPRVLQYFVYSRENHLLPPSITHLLHNFLERCSTMQLNAQLEFHPAPAKKAYGGVAAYMKVIRFHQPQDSMPDTLAHLTRLCKLSPISDLIHKKPFLMIPACFYLDLLMAVTAPLNYAPLLNTIVEACGIGTWDRHFGLDTAIDAIYNYHNPSNQPTNSSTSVVRSSGSDSHE